MGSFSESIQRNINAVLETTNRKCYAIVYDLFVTVVSQSPTTPFAKYSTGLLINNWFPEENGFSSLTTSATNKDGIGSLNRISSIPKGRVFYGKDGFISLSNSLSYAYRAEYLGWPSSDNPAWSGRVGPYAPIRNSLTIIGAKYVN